MTKDLWFKALKRAKELNSKAFPPSLRLDIEALASLPERFPTETHEQFLFKVAERVLAL